jgi:hypothetical protein
MLAPLIYSSFDELSRKFFRPAKKNNHLPAQRSSPKRSLFLHLVWGYNIKKGTGIFPYRLVIQADVLYLSDAKRNWIWG